MEVNNNYIHKESKSKYNGICKLTEVKFMNEVITFLVACVSYSNGLHGDFLHDDIFAIKNNKDVTGKNGLLSVFYNDFWGKPMLDSFSHKSYRPLTTLTFRLNYSLCGSEPFYFHLVNVYLHAVVTSLFTWICQNALYLSPRCSLVAGLIFAVHPIHVEAVTGLVGRAELLSALFFLLSFLLYTKSINIHRKCEYPTTDNACYFVLSMVLGATAMLCKEQGIMVLPVCLLYDTLICCRRGVLKSIRERKCSLYCFTLVKRLGFNLFTIVCLVLFRWWIMNGQLPSFQHQDNPASFSPYLVTRCLSYPFVWCYNVYLLLLPSTLCYDWQVGSIPIVESFADLRNLATLSLFVLFVLYLIKWKFYFKESPANNYSDVILTAFLFSVMPFIPASNLLFRVGFVVAERTLYLPSTGFCILISHGACLVMNKNPQYKHHTRAAIVFLIFTLLCKTWMQNMVWNTRETLFVSGIRSLPNNAKIHYNYANMLKDTGKIEDAIEEYKIAIQLYPDHASSHNNLGTVLTNITESMYQFERALEIYPEHPGALINLGARKFKRGNKADGLQMLEKALDIDPHNVEALMTLGGMMADLNRWTEAESMYREAITEKPDFAEVYHNYGTYLHLKGDIEEAIYYYQTAFHLDSHHSVSIVNAARGLRQLGKLDEATTILHQALAFDRSTPVLDLLGLIYYQMGRMAESVSTYEEILKENPNNTDAMTHYAQVLANNGESYQAELLLLNVLHQNPNHAEALHYLSNIFGQRGKHQEALEYLQRAIELQEEADEKGLLENMYFQQGNHYKDLKQYDKALQSYRNSIRLNPKNSKSHVNVGAIFHLKGDFQQARKHYSEVLKLEPHNDIVLQNLERLKKTEEKSHIQT